MRMHAVTAIWRRQLSSLLGNPLGYVFVLAFVLVSAGFLFVPDAYFARNIADLGPLHEIMPWLLVVLLPALAMGTWASERELGTEEQLLTLPLTEVDALLGKWLGVATFFTLALLCSLSNLVVLAWLGDPDVGLVLANYVGWWLAGLVFAAIGIFASTMVSLPAIAFVIGALSCAGVMLGAGWVDWFEPFERGVVGMGPVVLAVAAVLIALGAGHLLLGARRWQPASKGRVTTLWITAACLAVAFLNTGVLADRAGIEVDTTSEGLSSLSPTSIDVLRALDEPVRITAFISRDLPPELALKGKEVENKLKVLERELGNELDLTIHRPADPLDDAGSLASQHFGLTPKTVVIDTVAGREMVEVFLGVVVTSGSRSQSIEHFDPGLSVEYELVRTLRAVGAAKKRVLGVVKTDLDMLGGFNYETGQMRQEWQVVSEWRKQYDVREVNLDADVSDEIDVLVVPQPSRLEQDQLERLHEYVWNGGPALILEDPLPLFSGAELGTSQPRQKQNPMMRQPPQEDPDKADLRPFLASLGIDMGFDEIAWSEFNPSHRFRGAWPRSMVWSFRDKGGIPESAPTTGIESLLFPWPGLVRPSPVAPPGIVVRTLVTPIPGAPFGRHSYQEHFTRSFFGMQKTNPRNYDAESGEPEAMAVEISGTMPRAYDYPRRENVDEEDADATPDDEDADTEDTADGTEDDGENAEEKDEEEEPEAPPTGRGDLSPKSIHVVFVADTDLAHDQFFQLYRNANADFNEEDLQFLLELRNVQFLANMVDTLAGDEDFLELRTRRAQRRPLTVLEDVLLETQTTLNETSNRAQTEAEGKIASLQSKFDERLAKVDETPGLDESAKEQLRKQIERSARRQLDADIERINRDSDAKVREAKIAQQRRIEAARRQVRWLALGVPAALLLFLAASVFIQRMKGERLQIPESRRREDGS